ncbi:MAG TPA: MarR family transcriptional regulator [Caulobacteraceae bacterium]|nr:MarR family transcriptional regulator [Caulobacteraceae bacterium]
MYTAKVEPEGQDVCSALAQALLLAARRWRTRLNERLKAIGQTDARCAALAEIADCADGVVQRELSQRLGVEEPTAVRLLDALEAQGWVERRAHSLDRRAKVVQITGEAQPVLDQAEEIVADLQAEMFAEIDPADLAVCLRVLNQLTRKLDRV